MKNKKKQHMFLGRVTREYLVFLLEKSLKHLINYQNGIIE